MARTYTDEQRQHAVGLYVSDGLAAACRETGFPKQTIENWARKAGVRSGSPQTEAATVARQVSHADKRARLAERLLDVALSLVDEVADTGTAPADRRALAVPVGIFVDKHQLLTGGATDRRGFEDPAVRAARLTELRDELAELRARRGDAG